MEKHKVSVKVMNSYDYSHFEICLSTDEEVGMKTANELRKKAQRLVDESIRQYKKAKELAAKRDGLAYEKQSLSDQVEKIKKKPESEWDAKELAKVKQLSDERFWSKYDYDYDDDWEDD